MSRRNAAPLGVRRSVLCGMGMTLLLAGCSTSTTCVSWVSYATPQDAYDDAVLVVVGTPGEITGTRDVLGATVPVHAFAVEQTLKGAAPDELSVAQTPLTCSPDAGPDALATEERVVLFLTREGGAYRPLTPDAGVLELPVGDPLPFVADAG